MYFFSSTLRLRAVHIPELREDKPRSARKYQSASRIPASPPRPWGGFLETLKIYRLRSLKNDQKFGGYTGLQRVSFVGWWVVDGGWAVYFFSSTLRLRAVHIPELREDKPRSARKYQSASRIPKQTLDTKGYKAYQSIPSIPRHTLDTKVYPKYQGIPKDPKGYQRIPGHILYENFDFFPNIPPILEL